MKILGKPTKILKSNIATSERPAPDNFPDFLEAVLRSRKNRLEEIEKIKSEVKLWTN